MRVAIVDLGTNSVRFDIHELALPDRFVCLKRYKEMVRLGEDVFKTSRLQPAAMARTRAAIKDFLKTAEKYEVEHIVGVATSASREAKNGAEFLKQLKSEFGFEIKLISGEEEARLILKGIQTFEPLAQETFAFIDIGGGSTEVGVSKGSETIFLDSFALGAARLSQKLKNSPPLESEVAEVRSFIRRVLSSRVGFREWPKIDYLLGASGTVKAILKIMKEMGLGLEIPRRHLKDLVQMMLSMNQNELIHIPGMEEKRLDIIIPGAILLEEMMDFFQAKRVYRTKFALREGLLQETFESIVLGEQKKKIIFM